MANRARNIWLAAPVVVIGVVLAVVIAAMAGGAR